MFGSDDYVADIGAVRTKSASELLYARQKMVNSDKFLLEIQWGSENRTFKIRIHSKSGHFEGWISDGKCAVFECPVFEWLLA